MRLANATAHYTLDGYAVEATYFNGALYDVRLTIHGTERDVPCALADLSTAALVRLSERVHAPLRAVEV